MGDPLVLIESPTIIQSADGRNTGQHVDPDEKLISGSTSSDDKEYSPDLLLPTMQDSEPNKHEAMHSARSFVMETPPFTKPFPVVSAYPKENKLPKLNLATKVQIDPFDSGQQRQDSLIEIGPHADEHAEPPPLPPSPHTKQQAPVTNASAQTPDTIRVHQQPKEDPQVIIRQPLLFHPAFIEGKDPLSEVLDWLGHSDIGLHQLPPDAASNSLIDDGRTHSFDFVALDDDGTSARAQIPREWPPKQAQPHLQMLSSKCPVVSAACVGDPRKVSGDRLSSERLNALLAEDEEEWLQRQQRTGTVGRLVIYAANESPQDDVVLRGGSGRPLIVTSVSDCGPASRAGIKAGDRLASINGKKHFTGLSADAVRAQLFHPPLMLVFLGFVGKLQAEVRLTSATGICGMPLRREVSRGNKNAPITLCDQTIFRATAPLFLTVREETESMMNLGSLFELQRLEAASIVQNALVHAMHDGPMPMPHTPRREVREEQPTLEASIALARSTHGQEEPQKPGGDVGAVGDGAMDEPGVDDGEEENDGAKEKDDGEEKTKRQEEKRKEADEDSQKNEEAKTEKQEWEEEYDDMLRMEHNIPRIPGMMFPATDRVIGAGLTPRNSIFDTPRTPRSLAHSVPGPRASKPLVPCVVDPDACRLERFCV